MVDDKRGHGVSTWRETVKLGSVLVSSGIAGYLGGSDDSDEPVSRDVAPGEADVETTL
jgi:hypothetical protein